MIECTNKLWKFKFFHNIAYIFKSTNIHIIIIKPPKTFYNIIYTLTKHILIE